MVDQTKFTTVESAMEILRDLMISTTIRHSAGETFTVGLRVNVPSEDDVQEVVLTLIVNRLAPEEINERTRPLANRDHMVSTTARYEHDAQTFDIDILLPIEDSKIEGAEIRVSPDLETILLRHLVHDLPS